MTTYRQERSASLGELTVETMVYVDRGVVTTRAGSTEAVNYVLSIMNIVSYLTSCPKKVCSSYVDASSVLYNLQLKISTKRNHLLFNLCVSVSAIKFVQRSHLGRSN